MSNSRLHPFDMGDPRAPKGSESWCRWLHFEILRLAEGTEEIEVRLMRHVAAFEDTRAFEKLTDASGRSFVDFADYCRTPEPYGLGRTPDVLRKEIKLRSRGTNQYTRGGDNITSSPKERGTDRDYTVARLERDRPDLAERVEAGELSANAAAIEAKHRSPRASINLSSPESAAATIKVAVIEKKASPTFIAELCAALADGD
jgi:hypothetical protein